MGRSERGARGRKHVSRRAMSRAALALFALFGCASASNDVGKKFLEENKNKPGVITLPSGLQYKVIREGSGDSHPTADSSCSCHYEGRVAQNWPNGETFDSSYARGEPTSFAPNQVIKGWTEAMQLMVEGDKWEMYTRSIRSNHTVSRHVVLTCARC